ncbi:sulfurtransferase TusA family protein [Vibrio sp. IRLE0018]|uniref:sulfurtransferase TusA family protein n=1 Tax=Vibrio TaxID=662 RepID=UPI001593C9EA|nr:MULTISPECIES: sulfurtransferase TusA family protein [Vibrio]MCF8780868.1 sulfurtransferase TusA family protein [Vibrio floridensis]NVC62776.1 sulfurtransferase TusA family protein [Vibrio sp. 05-20-BW147]
MERKRLDLRQQRCPMSLLLAKRHSAELSEGSQLVIQVSDQGSMRDIVRYLQSRSFIVETKMEQDCYLLHITLNKESSYDV